MYRARQNLEALSEFTGNLIAWLTLAMVIVTFVIVVLRYALDLGWIAMQESVTWMHAAVFMLGAAYTLKHDEHVRVDIFFRKLPARRKALVNLSGTLVFLLPMAVFLTVASWDYVSTSWAIRESSREAGGLPFPFVPILKSLIPATAIMLILQGIANVLGAILALTGKMPNTESRKVATGDLI